MRSVTALGGVESMRHIGLFLFGVWPVGSWSKGRAVPDEGLRTASPGVGQPMGSLGGRQDVRRTSGTDGQGRMAGCRWAASRGVATVSPVGGIDVAKSM